MEGFQINYTDLSDLFWEYKRKIENLIENIDNCIERISMFTENACLLYTSPSPRDRSLSRMPSSA